MSNVKKAAILGASGYTGAETIRLLLGHPNVKIVALTGHSNAGREISEIYPNLLGRNLPSIISWDEVDWSEIDVAFACLPHGASQETIAAIRSQVPTIIDLSADFRLADPALYEKTYGRPHNYPALLKSAVYGLTEFARDNLTGAALVACPGCYPTCSLLSLLPGIKAGLFKPSSIIIDAKSGITGAGRKISDRLIYSELTDGAHAYGVGNHRHAPEIDQMLTRVTGNDDIRVSFTPHLIPMNRGMITTIYVDLAKGFDLEFVQKTYKKAYENEPFIIVSESVPETRHFKASNRFGLGLFKDRVEHRIILIGVIDNLTKGSAGQAVQNYNLTQGWDETLGLMGSAAFP
ncbi:MAG: N-acetyl-gamma-glutamyl-phosphate reductase [Hellea sp.]|nr:N-acetyl-gamma-glutamyl-phosphate reductase [Hellea sp.]